MCIFIMSNYLAVSSMASELLCWLTTLRANQGEVSHQNFSQFRITMPFGFNGPTTLNNDSVKIATVTDTSKVHECSWSHINVR